MKKKIDVNRFIELYTDGFTAKKIAEYFNASLSTVWNIKSCMKLIRILNCDKCGKQFLSNHFSKYKCNLCSAIDLQIFFLRKEFGRLCNKSPDIAKEIEEEMKIVEGESFREFALDGIEV